MRRFRAFGSLALALALLASPAVHASSVLFIGDLDGDANGDGAIPAVAAADAAMLSRISSLGYTAVALDDGVASPADLTGISAVFISASSSSGVIKDGWDGTGHDAGGPQNGALLRDLALPVVLCENGLSDELGYATQTVSGQGEYPGSGVLNVLLPSHPLAVKAGLSGGPTSVLTAAGPLTGFANDIFFGSPRTAPGFDIIATFEATAFPGLPFAGLIMADAGDAMGGPGSGGAFSAPAMRIGLPLATTTFTNLDADGLAVFDAVLMTAVPEPATWTLGLLGLVGLAWTARRRRTN